MGVDTKNLTGVGVVLKNRQEIKNYIQTHALNLNEKQQEALNEAAIEDFLYVSRSEMEIECLNAFHGEWFFLGFKIQSRNPEEFAEKILTAAEQWNSIFGQKAEMITDVVVY